MGYVAYQTYSIIKKKSVVLNFHVPNHVLRSISLQVSDIEREIDKQEREIEMTKIIDENSTCKKLISK